MESSNRIYFYQGSIQGREVETILHDIEKISAQYNVHSALWKKVYIVVVELISNIERHATVQPEAKNSYIQIEQQGRYIFVEAGNVVQNKEVNALQTRIEKVHKQANYDHLKQYYLDKVVSADISVKGGAGLGIITMAKICRNAFTYNIRPLKGSLSFFTIRIKLE